MKKISIILMAIILTSCSSDDDASGSEENNDLVFSSYIETYNRPEIDDVGSYKTLRLGDINKNKFTNYQFETFLDGNLKDSHLYDHFVYEDEKLTDYYPFDEKEAATKQQIFYNENENISGVYWERPNRYYRIQNISDKVNYFEVLTNDFEDENSEVYRRYIIQFDSHNNIEKAGIDDNLDSIMDYENHFSYDGNHNLTNIEMGNGENISISYSDVKNTESFLFDNSFGKKIRRLFCSEVYGGQNIELIKNLKHSPYLTNEEVSSAIFIETHESGFYTIFEEEINNGSTRSIEYQIE